MAFDHRSAIEFAENRVKTAMANNDPSHDVAHVLRVRDQAMRIANKISVTGSIDKFVVEVAALYHDLLDYKYVSSDKYDSIEDDLKTGLISEARVPAETVEVILRIVRDCGYQREKKLKSSNSWTEWHEKCLEFHW